MTSAYRVTLITYPDGHSCCGTVIPSNVGGSIFIVAGVSHRYADWTSADGKPHAASSGLHRYHEEDRALPALAAEVGSERASGEPPEPHPGTAAGRRRRNRARAGSRAPCGNWAAARPAGWRTAPAALRGRCLGGDLHRATRGGRVLAAGGRADRTAATDCACSARNHPAKQRRGSGHAGPDARRPIPVASGDPLHRHAGAARAGHRVRGLHPRPPIWPRCSAGTACSPSDAIRARRGARVRQASNPEMLRGRYPRSACHM